MDLYVKAVGMILVSMMLVLALEKQATALLLTTVTCAMAAAVAVNYLTPVKSFLQELQSLADLQDGLMGILLKCTGVALISELVGHICQDAGIGSFQKTVHLLGNSVILYLSIPAFQSLLTLLKEILNEL